MKKNNEKEIVKLNLVGYIRVSTLPQVEGTSIDVQKETILNYCKIGEHTLTKFYIDRGVSGAVKRPKFEGMIKKTIETQEIDGVICYDLTRFGRNTIDLLTNITLLENANKKFISVKENIDTSSYVGELILQIFSAISQFERKRIIERLKEGKEWAKIHGTKSGKPMHRPKKDVDWEFVKEMRKLGLSWNKISKLWNNKTTDKKKKISVPTLIKRGGEEGIE